MAVRLAAQDAKLAPSLIAYRLESSRCNQTATQELLPSSPRTGRLPLVAALLLWLVMAWPLAAQAPRQLSIRQRCLDKFLCLLHSTRAMH